MESHGDALERVYSLAFVILAHGLEKSFLVPNYIVILQMILHSSLPNLFPFNYSTALEVFKSS